MVKCPYCGNLIPEKKKRLRRTIFESSQKLYNAAAAVTHPPAHIPAHLPNRESHIFVPLTQALITGGFVGAIGVVSVSVIGYMGRLPLGEATTYGCLSGVCIFLGVAAWQWHNRLQSYDSLLWKAEEFTGLDINQDSIIGQPGPQTVKVEVKEENSGRWQFAELRIEQGKLKNLAKAILAGQTFAERTATDSGISQEEFRDLRDKFIDRGWAQWNHPNRRQQGVSLTHRGRFILQTIAHQPQLVSSQDDLSERYLEIDR